MRLELEYETNAPVATLDTITTLESPAPGDPAALVKSGIAAAQKGDRENARELLARAAKADPQNEDAWMWLASISDYPEELLAFLNKVLAINPTNQRAVEWHAATRSLLAKTFVQRGIAAQREGGLELAESWFDQAPAHDEKCSLAWVWKTKVATSDEYKIECLERTIELDPDNEDAQKALALVKPAPGPTLEDAKWAAVAGKRKKALEILDEVLENSHDDAEAWILRSHLATDLNDKLKSLVEALAIDPENESARASYDFLSATVRDANAAEAKQVVVDEPAVPAADPIAESVDEQPFDEPVAEPVDEAAADPAIESEVADEAAATPVVELVADEHAGEHLHGSPFDAPAEEFIDFEADAHDDETNHEGRSETADAAEDSFAAEIFDTQEEIFAAEAVETHEEIVDAEIVAEADEIVEENTPSAVCVFCNFPIDPQAFACGGCHAVLTLSDMESLLANTAADRDTIQESVTRMEAEWNQREFDIRELTILGIGHFNVRSFDQGFKYLQEASRLDQNNVILAGQVNALAIRLDEMRRQEAVHDAMPKGKAILVVDDSPTVRKLISAKLEKSGHHVTCAADGVEGLEKLNANGGFDLVLLDIAMPRMDGYEVCRQIRTDPAAATLPVVMISGKDGFFDKVRGKMAGCTGYVTKPFGPETLMRALETYLLPENGNVE